MQPPFWRVAAPSSCGRATVLVLGGRESYVGLYRRPNGEEEKKTSKLKPSLSQPLLSVGRRLINLPTTRCLLYFFHIKSLRKKIFLINTTTLLNKGSLKIKDTES
jgi:hypothetical protein